jgi:RNA polymerase sigma factor (sigma-70 family)
VTGPGRGELEMSLRELTPRVLAALMRRCQDFAAAEDALQDALLAAATQWPLDGLPERPDAWLITVASRRLADQQRRDRARRQREERLAEDAQRRGTDTPPAQAPAGPAGSLAAADGGTLELLILCCHPGLAASAQIALTLRAVGGLTTSQIAAAFLVPEATMTRRISRAKQKLAQVGAVFRMPSDQERPERVRAVLHVLYLIFNEGYTASAGHRLHRGEVTAATIRLTRELRSLLPGDGEVAGLLALMLLTEARSPARVDGEGALVPLAGQDRGRWDRAMIAEGAALITGTLAAGRPGGPYQLQAAIAALHAEAPDSDHTDWAQITALYVLLETVAPNPVVTLNRAVATAMAYGPQAGLRLLAPLADDRRLAAYHRFHAVRGHLHEMAGQEQAARRAYQTAFALCGNETERRYLERLCAS